MKRDPAHTFSSEIFDLSYYSCADLVMPIDRYARFGRFSNVRKARLVWGGIVAVAAVCSRSGKGRRCTTVRKQ